MGARRYEIYLRLFTLDILRVSAANEWDIEFEHNKINSYRWLTKTRYQHVKNYRIRTHVLIRFFSVAEILITHYSLYNKAFYILVYNCPLRIDVARPRVDPIYNLNHLGYIWDQPSGELRPSGTCRSVSRLVAFHMLWFLLVIVGYFVVGDLVMCLDLFQSSLTA
jgi:hypothetical protein